MRGKSLPSYLLTAADECAPLIPDLEQLPSRAGDMRGVQTGAFRRERAASGPFMFQWLLAGQHLVCGRGDGSGRARPACIAPEAAAAPGKPAETSPTAPTGVRVCF